MRPFWHLGPTVLIVFLTLGRRRIDYRVVLLGALLPDLIDLATRPFVGEHLRGSQLFGHTLALPLLLLLSVQLFLRGASARRWFVLPMAILIHLALDGMWNDPVTLFWPLFSIHFPSVPPQPSWLDVIAHPFEHTIEVLKEAGGLALLLYMGYLYDLHRGGPMREFLRTGKLTEPRAAPGSPNGRTPLG